MKKFELVIEDSTTKKRQHLAIQAVDFPSAASIAYLKRHTLAYAGTGWKILSLSEKGWGVISV